MKQNPILEVDNLSISFNINSIKYIATSQISFSLHRKESIALVGESGSGKTVTAKALMGLNPSETSKVDSGRIYYKGTDLLSLSENALREFRGKEIGMIFQDPIASLNPTMKIGNQIKESLKQKHRTLSHKEAVNRVLELIHLVGIPSPKKIYHAYPHELSGGMRQRVMIAISLAAEPKILIADEPTTALDVTIQAEILDLLKRLQEKFEMSIIFITHDMSLVADFCSQIIVMYGGRIVEKAPTFALFENPRHPYTKRLLESIPRLDLKKNDPLIPIDGSPPKLDSSFSGCPFCPRCFDAMNVCDQKNPPNMETDEERSVACWLYAKPTAVDPLEATCVPPY
jgi:oligopeptide transport system ATP-binding protein